MNIKDIIEYLDELNLPEKIKRNLLASIVSGLGNSLKELASLPADALQNYKRVLSAKTDAKIRIIEAASIASAEIFGENKEIAYRALDNLASNIISDHKNKEMIALKSLQEFQSKQYKYDTSEQIGHDWLNLFWENAKHINNDDLQNILAKLLISEIENPGSVGINTILTLIGIRKCDLEAFQKLCNISCKYEDSIFIYPLDSLAFQNLGPLDKYNVSFDELLDIESLGLIRSVNTIHLSFTESEQLKRIDLAGRQLNMKLNEGRNYLLLTPTGRNIRNNMILKPNDEYLKDLLEKFPEEVSTPAI